MRSQTHLICASLLLLIATFTTEARGSDQPSVSGQATAASGLPAEPAANQVRRPRGQIEPLDFTGVNLAGGEFGTAKAGEGRTYGVKYIYPSASQMDFFVGKGVNIIRFPFRWSDLQPALKQPLNPAVLDWVRKIVTESTGKGLVVILSPHDYARHAWKTMGSPEVPHEAFTDFWSRLATPFSNNPRVWFGLMNEPHDMPNEQWLTTANAAIAAIRNTGATNKILVLGNSWTRAHSWISSRNGEVMLQVVDPLDHFAIEVHQYLDEESSGTKPEAVSAIIGRERLQRFTTWCRTHHRRAFLGEFGAANNETAAQATDDMLGFMEENRDVWIGFTYWAGGAWWGDYMFTLEPKNGQDRPQMAFLRRHLQKPTSNP